MPAKRAPRAARCTYKEGKRRCPYDGTGDPALCDPHRIAIAEASRPRTPVEVLLGSLGDLLSGQSINTDATLGAAADLFGNWKGLGADWHPDVEEGESENSSHRRAQSGQAPWTRARAWAAQQVDPVIEAQRAARRVMGFAQGLRLTEDMVTDRKRELAKRYHPDKPGGSTEKMAEVNDAADVLMESL